MTRTPSFPWASSPAFSDLSLDRHPFVARSASASFEKHAELERSLGVDSFAAASFNPDPAGPMVSVNSPCLPPDRRHQQTKGHCANLNAVVDEASSVVVIDDVRDAEEVNSPRSLDAAAIRSCYRQRSMPTKLKEHC